MLALEVIFRYTITMFTLVYKLLFSYDNHRRKFGRQFLTSLYDLNNLYHSYFVITHNILYFKNVYFILYTV